MNATARDIADRLGLKKHPRSWRGDCPACSYARAFTLKTGRDGRPVALCIHCSRETINDALQRVMGGAWTPPERPEAEDVQKARQRKQEAALRLWRGSEGAPGTPVEVYLRARGLAPLSSSAALRFRPDCHHPEAGKPPAMVALVTDAADQPIAAHRTYLRRDGTGKADIEPAKASLGPVWGGAIRLDPAAPELVIGEGIESSASAGILLGLPAWAALSAGNLARGLVLPPEVQSIVIAADPDKAGREAAATAADRWRRKGRRVRIAVPNREGKDFNDLLLERADAGR